MCTVLVCNRENAPTDNGKLALELSTRRTWGPDELGVTTLPLFDIVIEQSGVARAGYERKTAADVLASYLDKRLFEQLGRICLYAREHPDVIVGYIIEGDMSTLDYGQISPVHIRHELWRLSTCGITVVYVNTVHETCDFILSMREQLGRSLSVEQAQRTAEENRQLYVGRKRDVTEEEYLKQTLQIVYGISPQHASAIASRHGSMCAFAKAIQTNPKLLVGIEFDKPSKKGGIIKRKIGAALSQKVHRYWVNQPNTKTPKKKT
jgi:ERCC4-type nuclease